MLKKDARLRRARKVRANISKLGIPRLTVHRTPRHIYAQIISPDGASIIAAASTLNSADKIESGSTGNIEAAKSIGRVIAEKSIAAGISDVAFDRSGFKYHGRIAALADSARENGLKF